jgi:hypothetical protein
MNGFRVYGLVCVDVLTGTDVCDTRLKTMCVYVCVCVCVCVCVRVLLAEKQVYMQEHIGEHMHVQDLRAYKTYVHATPM